VTELQQNFRGHGAARGLFATDELLPKPLRFQFHKFLHKDVECLYWLESLDVINCCRLFIESGIETVCILQQPV